MRRTGAFILSLSITAATAACGGEEPAEMFALVDIGGEPLPVTYPEEAGCEEELMEATLSLEADGEWELHMTKREICGDAVEDDEDEEEGTYTVDGASYTFESPQRSPGPRPDDPINREVVLEQDGSNLSKTIDRTFPSRHVDHANLALVSLPSK